MDAIPVCKRCRVKAGSPQVNCDTVIGSDMPAGCLVVVIVSTTIPAACSQRVCDACIEFREVRYDFILKVSSRRTGHED